LKRILNPGIFRVERRPKVSFTICPTPYFADPLLPSNNLGRSVSQGNAKRIRKALSLGAARLSALRESTSSDDMTAVRVRPIKSRSYFLCALAQFV
jgi:hypothetical protein